LALYQCQKCAILVMDRKLNLFKRFYCHTGAKKWESRRTGLRQTHSRMAQGMES
jgi:hypothetical protein